MPTDVCRGGRRLTPIGSANTDPQMNQSSERIIMGQHRMMALSFWRLASSNAARAVHASISNPLLGPDIVTQMNGTRKKTNLIALIFVRTGTTGVYGTPRTASIALKILSFCMDV